MPDTPSFDLRTEPWIPATFISDGQEHMVSLTDALLNARDIRSIGGDMPIQTPAITRLLLSVLYGLCPGGPPLDEWRELWDEGPFGDDITDYLDQYADRWDLFDERTPFFQVADLRTEKGTYSGLEKLIFDVPNGDPFFTTRLGEGLQRISFAEAARWLVTAQAFDPSGIKSGAVGDPRVKGGKGYPIGIAWTGNLGVLICEGANLWQTLLLNFVGSGLNPHGEPLPWSDDMPAWERPQPTALATPGLDQEHPGDIRRFHGPATLMTWQSRRIRLIHDDQWVTGVIIANGDQLKPQMADSYETMTAWRESEPQEKALGQPLVYMPRAHTPSRAIWRGIATFLPSGAISGEQPPKSKPPLTVDWLHKLEVRNLLPDIQVRMHAYGVTYGSNNSVIDEVVDDAMDLHLHVLASDSDDLKQCFVSAAGMADRGADICRSLASNLALAAGIPSDAWRTQATQQAYAAFDRLYRNWAAGIASPDQVDQAREQWRSIVRTTLNDLGDSLLAQAPPSAFTGRYDTAGTLQSAGKADLFFRSAVNKLTAAPPIGTEQDNPPQDNA